MTKLFNIRQAASFWGWWPAVVMALAQAEVARLRDSPYPRVILGLTLTGTMLIYGLEHLTESFRFAARHARHLWSPFQLALVPPFAVACFFWALPQLSPWTLCWLGTLLGLGSCYVLVSQGFFPKLWWSKEPLGALIFTILVWGYQPIPPSQATLGFFFVGLANFYWASWFDRERDRTNRLLSFPQMAPTTMTTITRLLALTGTILLITDQPQSLPFVFMAGMHTLWSRKSPHIDAAFLPLVLGPLWF